MKGWKSISALILLSFGCAIAQDNHFTLYNHTPLLLNPAQTASMTGELRAGALYRNQWRAVDKPFTTITAYADKKIFLKGFDLGVGLSILNDRSGPGRLNVMEIYPSVSIQKYFGGHNVTVGVQPGFVHKRIQEDITFPSQYDHAVGGYTTSLPSGEAGDPYEKAFFDLNVGVGYVLNSNKYELRIGQAFHHVNVPNESFISDEKDNLPVRYTTHASYRHWLKEKVYIMPYIQFMSQNKATEFVFNVHAGYRVIYEEKVQVTVRLGAAYRNNTQNVAGDSFFGNSDAASALAGISWNRIDMDFAYDINVSKLSEGGKNAGAFEIALTYKNAFERKNNRITVPCRRY